MTNPHTIGTARVSKDPPKPPTPSTNLLAYYRLGPPSALELPESAEAWAKRFVGKMPLPSAIYSCTEQGDADLALVDRLHSKDDSRKLTPPGGEGAPPLPLYKRRAVGLRANAWDGTIRIHPERGVELYNRTQRFAAPNSGLYDVGDAESIVMLAVFRTARRARQRIPFRSIAGKQARARERILASVEPAIEAIGGGTTTGPGYAFGVDGSGHAAFVFQPVGTRGARIVSPGRVDDGAWHCAVTAISRIPLPPLSETVTGSGQTQEVVSAFLLTDGGDVSSQYAWPTPVSFSNDASFCIGASQDELYPSAHVQVAYLAVWSGQIAASDAESLLTGEENLLRRFWTANLPRKNLITETGGELVLSRKGGTLGWPAGADPFGEGNCVAKYSGSGENGDLLLNGAMVKPSGTVAQYPYTVMGEAALAYGGFGCNGGSVANLLRHSEAFTRRCWSVSGTDVDLKDKARDAPDGMRTACRATFASGATGWILQAPMVRSSEEGAEHVASIWVRYVSGPKNATLYLGGITDGTSGMKAFPLNETPLSSGKWVRIDAPVVVPEMDGSSVAFGLKLAVAVPEGPHAVKLLLWGAQLSDCGYPGPYLPTGNRAAYQSHDAALSTKLGPKDPYQIDPQGKISLKARLPYTANQANGRVLLTITGETSSEDGPETVRIEVLRKPIEMDGDGGGDGHVVVEVTVDNVLLVSCASKYAYGVAEGEGSDQAVDVPITFGWDFDSAEETIWLEVADEERRLGFTEELPAGFEGTSLCIGRADVRGSVAEGAPDAQISEVKVYKP